MLQIGLKEIHIWQVSLAGTEWQARNLMDLLSADEAAKAARLHFEKDRNRYIITRGILRRILGRYLGKAPEQLRFEYSASGKPMLVPEPGHGALHFNLSHSGGIALYAVSRCCDIGVDVERINGDIDFDLVARRFFSQGELSVLEKAPENKRSEVFFHCWSRKEACLKSLGVGISFPMEQFDVSSVNGSVFSPVIITAKGKEDFNLYVRDMFAGEDYVAAIAVTEAGCALVHCDYLLIFDRI